MALFSWQGNGFNAHTHLGRGAYHCEGTSANSDGLCHVGSAVVGTDHSVPVRQCSSGGAERDSSASATAGGAMETESALEAEFQGKWKPTQVEMSQIASRLGLTRDVVRIWFTNRRQKQKSDSPTGTYWNNRGRLFLENAWAAPFKRPGKCSV